MDRTQALALLPPVHAHALRLRDRDLDPAAIADRLGLEPEEVGTLLHVAEAKLHRLMRDRRHAPEMQ